jgi:hypothetical protein
MQSMNWTGGGGGNLMTFAAIRQNIKTESQTIQSSKPRIHCVEVKLFLQHERIF